MMEFKIKKRYLKKYLDKMSIANDEAKMTISEEDWHIKLVDPGHIFMADGYLHRSAFEEYPDEDEFEEDITIAFHFQHILNFLKIYKFDDVIEITIPDQDPINGLIGLSKGRIQDNNKTLDPTPMTDPKVPKLDGLSVKIENIPNRVFQGFIKLASNKTDHIRFNLFEWEEQGKLVKFRTEREFDDNTELEFWEYDEDVDIEIDGDEDEFTSLFALDYLEDIIKKINKTETIDRIRFGNDYPMEMIFDQAEKKYGVRYLLAPRIETTPRD